MPRTVNSTPGRRKGNTPDRGSEALWHSALAALRELGGFSAQLEGHRLHIKLTHFHILKKFVGAQWSGWTEPPGYCRFALHSLTQHILPAASPLPARRSHCEIVPHCIPVRTWMDAKGRLYLPEQLALCSGIKERSIVFVLPCPEFIEVWNYKRFASRFEHHESAQ